MRWAAAMALFAASSWYLYKEYLGQAAPPPAPVVHATPPVKPAPVLSAEDMARVRKNARNGDAGVRWASIQLLYALGDPESLTLLEKAVGNDEPEPELRMKAIKLLAKTPKKESLPGLVRGLQSPDKAVRLESLQALEQLGDPGAIRWITQTVEKEWEPEVKAQALRALGTFQDRRREQFEALSAKLREDYEKAVERTRKEFEEKPEAEAPKLEEAPLPDVRK